MPGFEAFEKLPRWPQFSLLCILQALPDTFFGIGTRRNVEQTLICFSILHNGRRLTHFSGRHCNYDNPFDHGPKTQNRGPLTPKPIMR